MTTASSSVTGLVTVFATSSDLQIAPFTAWLVDLMMSGAEFPGFWSGEIIPPQGAGHKEWTLVERFRTPGQTATWKQSDLRAKVLARLSGIAGCAEVSVSDSLSDNGTPGSVATAIVTDVKPGMETAYWQWEKKIQSAQAKYPGYRGVYLQPPVPGGEGKWATLLRFDSPQSLEQWFASGERKQLLAEADQFIEATHFSTLTSSFPGWFPADAKSGAAPPKWKTAVLVVLGLYPILMLQRRFLLPLFAGANTALMVSCSTLISVPLVTWVTMPILIRVFSWWLLPQKEKLVRLNFMGCFMAALLLACEAALFWHLLPPVR